MKHTLFILALLTATIQIFAQSPRIKLNQITKDSVTGSVLISSPTDSGMVYSRDLFISYGADTVLILGGDTLAATSGIISSVLSDGVTITGDGTTGNELTADTSVLATLRALSDSLALISSSVTADGVTITGDGTAGSPLKVDTTTYIATKQDLDAKQDQLNGTGFVKATGTSISYDNSTYLTSEVDGSVTNEIQDISTTGAAGNISISSGSTLNLNVDDADASASNELQTLSYNSSTNEITLSDGGGTEDLSNLDLVDSTRINATGDTAYYYQNGVLIGTGPIAGGGGGTTYNNITETVDTVYITDYLDVDTSTLYVDASTNRVGIGTSTPDSPLDVIGPVSIKWGLDQNTSQPGLTIGADLDPPNGQSTLTDEFPKGGAIHGYHYDNDEPQIGLLLVTSTSTGNNVAFGNYSNSINGPTRMFFRTANTARYPNSFVEAMLIDSTGAVNFDHDLSDASVTTMYVDAINDRVGIGTTSPSYQLQLSTNSAAKPTSNTWTIASDERVKKNIVPYNKGLDAILQLNPIEYDYNGLGGFKEGYGGIGIIAQQAKPIIPETISFYKAKLNPDDVEETTLLNFDSHPLTFMFINAFKEQQAIIEQQATEIETLKTQIQLILSEIEQLKNN